MIASPLRLILSVLPDNLLGPAQPPYNGRVPKRMRFAHPDLAKIIVALEAAGVRLRYSDILRSAEVSLARRHEFEARGGKQLAKRPGESPHNWGLSVDIDTKDAMTSMLISKQQLDELLQAYGLWCHRRDHVLGDECWHYNALGVGEEAQKWLAFASQRSTSRAVEEKIASLYSKDWVLSKDQVAACLIQLKKKDVRDFQDDWDLDVDGIAGPKTQRLLAFLCAEKVFV